MSRTFNVLLLVGCLLSVAAAFIFTVKPAKTTNAAVPEAESATPPSLSTLTNTSFEQFLNTGIDREIKLKTQLQDEVSYEVTEYTAQSGDSLWSIANKFDLQPETIQHGNGYRTYYAHTEANLVSAGQVVVQGQQIAKSGSTGNSTREHLAFRIYYDGSFFNPLEYLP